VALRARIVLACDSGLPNRAVAKQLSASANCVCKWRERFRVRRLPGSTDEPRPGAPRQTTDDQIVEVITRTLEGPPAQATQWTTRGLADVAIHEYLDRYNDHCAPFSWTATADVILDKVSRFCQRTSGTRH
jgi:transposase